VAHAPVARGDRVQAAGLRLRRMPIAYVPPGSIGQIAKAAGRVALTDLAAGEAVTETRLARVRAGPVASLIPQGLRAFAVPSTLPPGTVLAGDRVDILATFGAGGAGQPHTEAVVEGVEILLVLGAPADGGAGDGAATFDAAGSGAASASTLMVLVSPDQEERLAYARAFANLEVTIDAADELIP